MKGILLRILSYFGIKIDQKEAMELERYNNDYEDTKETNIIAIVSNKISNMTLVDSDIYVSVKTTDKSLRRDKNALKQITNKRVSQLNEICKLLDKDLKKTVNRMLGTGGCVVIPKLEVNNQLGYTIVSQDRLFILKQSGEKILEADVLAENIRLDNGKNLYRFIEYRIIGNDISVINVVRNEAMEKVEHELNDNFIITNVDRCLFGYFKSPIDNRRAESTRGVPLTYGCDKTIKRIIETLEQIDKEFDNAESTIFASERLFDDSNNIPQKVKKVRSGPTQQEMLEIFSPTIRESSYYNKLTNLFETLELEIGLSHGTLTKLTTSYATATEIKKAMLDTYALVGEIRKSIEKGCNDLFYSLNVYANYYSLTPIGDYEIIYDWSYLLVEDSQQTFEQLERGESLGAVDIVEIRQFLFSDETMEESQIAIDKIKQENPNIDKLLVNEYDE